MIQAVILPPFGRPWILDGRRAGLTTCSRPFAANR